MLAYFYSRQRENNDRLFYVLFLLTVWHRHHEASSRSWIDPLPQMAHGLLKERSDIVQDKQIRMYPLLMRPENTAI